MSIFNTKYKMKQTRILLMACVALVCVGIISCSKDNNYSDNEENNGDGGTETVEWVDLGLPSGLLWAKCNLGANSPEEYGDYFAWGETQPKEAYGWNTYHYCTVDDQGDLQMLTKYNTSSTYGTVDSLTTLEAMDDAATAALGTGARTPTKEEWEELINNTTVEWTTMNGVNGRKFTASNGDSLFLPAAGFHLGTAFLDADNYGHYWSATLVEDSPLFAWSLNYSSDNQFVSGGCGHFYGLSVRAVRQN